MDSARDMEGSWLTSMHKVSTILHRIRCKKYADSQIYYAMNELGGEQQMVQVRPLLWLSEIGVLLIVRSAQDHC